MSNTPKTPAAEYQHQRGEIKDNKLKAVLTSPLFRTRVVKAKKGKGSYNRKAEKPKGRQSQDYAPSACGGAHSPALRSARYRLH